MPYGKTPLTPEQIAQLRSHAEAELAPRAIAPTERVSALTSHARDELDQLRRAFGADGRLQPLAITFAIRHVLDAIGRSPVDGEAVIEALGLEEKLDAKEDFGTTAFSDWAGVVTKPPPKKNAKRSNLAPSEYAQLSGIELYLAFHLADGGGIRNEPLRAALAQVLREATKRGARFVREPNAIIDEWVDALRLANAYVPGGNTRAPLAFLVKAFRFALDRERRSVGPYSFRPGWLRSMRRRNLLGSDGLLTKRLIESLQDKAHANMIHAPPPGFVTSALLRENLVERQEKGALAQRAIDAFATGSASADLLDDLRHLGLVDALREWLAEPPSTRPPLLPGVIAADVPTSPRSVDKLVQDYEKARKAPFTRSGRSRLIPIGEITRIVEFATARAANR